MKNASLRKIIFAALMAALTTVATMIIRIPTPTQGYIHLGDGMDSDRTHRLSLRRLRQRIPDRARRMVPDHRSHEQRHRLHPQLVL